LDVQVKSINFELLGLEFDDRNADVQVALGVTLVTPTLETFFQIALARVKYTHFQCTLSCLRIKDGLQVRHICDLVCTLATQLASELLISPKKEFVSVDVEQPACQNVVPYTQLVKGETRLSLHPVRNL